MKVTVYGVLQNRNKDRQSKIMEIFKTSELVEARACWPEHLVIKKRRRRQKCAVYASTTPSPLFYLLLGNSEKWTKKS